MTWEWGVVGSLVTLVGIVIAWPKIKAEARKTNAEASHTGSSQTLDWRCEM